MGLDDRRNREFADTIRGDMMAERLDNFAKVGPLLDAKATAALEWKIGDETRLPAPIVKDIVETMNGTIGKGVASAQEQTKEQTLHEIKEAFGGHVTNPKFLDRIAKEILPAVENQMKARDQRVEGLKIGAPVATVSAPSISAPTMGGRK